MSWYRCRHSQPAGSSVMPETKEVTATTSAVTYQASSDGYDGYSAVKVNPQSHTASFTPTANLVGASGNANDMGLNHNKRYINTSGMITPSGTKSITSNGTHDVSNYANASVSVDTSGTSITPSNSSPVRIYSGSTYTPTSSGYAISSYSSVTPSNSSPASLSSGSIYKTSGSGYAISSYSSISPSSSPTSLSSGSIYKMSSGGYAINDYSSSSKAPTSDGNSFSSGWNYMTSSGYAYSSKPSKKVTTDKLWQNSSPTSAMSAQDLTLSYNWYTSGYNFIIFEYIISNASNYAISSPQGGQVYVAPEFLAKYTGSSLNTINCVSIGGTDSGGTSWARAIQAVLSSGSIVGTKLHIGLAAKTNGSGTSSSMLILKYIYGQKITVG